MAVHMADVTLNQRTNEMTDLGDMQVELIPPGGKSTGEKAIKRTEEIRRWLNQHRYYVKGLEARIAKLESRLGQIEAANTTLK